MANWDGLFITQWPADRTDEPYLTDEERACIHDTLTKALADSCSVYMQTWHGRHFRHHRGTIRSVDVSKRTLTYADPFGEWTLPVDEITAIHITD
ncbi:YolD-like family protein [Indiicoccus explosivorum]|uniref:YolD-like family protein n=1 Tax=Indiicoccus explosivorum TaxID=1917864 RepID=UPI000B434EA7|nr:YolD-like family protein [Indiicoccus explosivorum]